MSRIGKAPVPVPDKVRITIDGSVVGVQGPRGTLSATLPERVAVSLENNEVVVQREDDGRLARAAHGLARTLVANMVEGVTTGFTRSLIINGVGYRCEARGERYLLFILGYSHPVLYELPEGVTATVNPKENSVTVNGPDKQIIGMVAAEIRSLRPPEPYKGKGIRYSDETIRRKEGKAGGK
ncbi:MAG: 50S ribosomal protein L6 [Deltaproteobacteria bacterium]|nr:MAG: 50S ribosomal protein L6 [Deltaproteobacteria bacterium]